MVHSLVSDKINYVKPVFSRRFSQEEILEVIVPDSKPDVLRVLSTSGVSYLRSKDAEQGRVMASGIVEAAVLYIPEDGDGINKLEVNIPYTVTADGTEITPESLIVTEISVLQADTRVINSRKLLVKAELSCNVTCSVLDSFSGSRAVELPDIFTRSETRKLLLPSAVGEKSFIFTDEVKLRSSPEPVGEILRSTVTLVCEDIKPVGRKAVVKGSAITEVAYCRKESPVIETERISTPFSQIVETDSETEPEKFTAALMLTSAYITRNYMEDSGVDCLSLELHAVAQCTAYSSIELNYVSDAYSPKYDIEPKRQQLEFSCLDEPTEFTDTLRCTIPADDADSVRLITVRPLQAACSGERQTAVTVLFTAEAVYEDRSGALWSASKRLECRHDFDMTVENRDVTAAVGECAAQISGGEIELRVPVSISVKRTETIRADMIEEIEYDEEAERDVSGRPSLTIVRAGERCGLWELAKENGSSIELIRAYNGLIDDQLPQTGAVLLIPVIR